MSVAFLAPALPALVGADARPQALLARACAAVMLAYLCDPTHVFLALALDTLVGADGRALVGPGRPLVGAGRPRLLRPLVGLGRSSF